MTDKQPEALRLAADWSVLFKNGMLDAEDIQDITDEFCRLHALCDEMGEALEAIAPFMDSLICYASTMTEYEPNAVAAKHKAALAKWKESK